jgi:GT2 family glycosyltransferase
MYVEDLEWCWRARKRGWEIYFEPAALVRHIGNASGIHMFGSRRTREHVRNAYTFYRREHGLAGTIAWWGLNLAGTSMRLAEALAARDRGRARRWTEHVTAHLAAVRPARALRGGRER